jgi:rhodanese-related sulfurtransferase
MSMHLSREGIIAGPSSGQALKGILDYVGRLKDNGELVQLADPVTGEISCVFTCSDLPYQYLPMYFQKLKPEEFPSIQNEVSLPLSRYPQPERVMLTPRKILLKCDQLKHDERWILTPSQAQQLLGPKSTSTSYTNKETGNVSEITLEPVHVESEPKETYAAPRRTTRSSVFRSCFGSLKRSNASTSSPGHRCCAAHPPSASSTPLVLDLRSKAAFKAQHIPGSVNAPLEVLTPDLADGDLFGDPDAVFKVWNPMETLIAGREMTKILEDTQRGRRAVVVVCYDGDASRLATAMLRDRGLEALSVQGGLAGFMR